MDVSKHGRRSEVNLAADLGLLQPLWRPHKGFGEAEGCWTWVVSSHGSVPRWQVRFLIGSEASRRPRSSRYCPVWSERPSAEWPGQDGSDCPQRSVAFQTPSIPCFTLAKSSAWRAPSQGQLQRITKLRGERLRTSQTDVEKCFCLFHEFSLLKVLPFDAPFQPEVAILPDK